MTPTAMSTASLPPVPETVGIALSGGGYRAAAFHLGALACLERSGLIKALKAVSTVSGGTFTGARYALALVKGASFADYFRDFYRDLRRFDLLKLGLEKLGGGGVEVPSGRHDLIVSVAAVYDETFFPSNTFGEILDAPSGIDEIAFNATEFRNGLAFRFQKSAKGRIGNGRISISRSDASRIRLADIVAASSCFPGGFEPIAFPDDFVWPENTVPETIAKAVDGRPLALMDGGIYDNQGIDSLLLADERARIDLDLFIISDVDQPSDDLYPFPETPGDTGLSLGAVNRLAWLLMVSCAATAALATRNAVSALSSGTFTFWDLFAYVMPMVLSGLTAYAIWWVRRTLRREIRRIPRVGHAAWKDLKKIRVGQLLGMVRLRISSLFAMASRIFMVRVRALVYRRVYEDEHYQGRRVSNIIYDLTGWRRFFFEKDARVPNPSAALVRVVEVAVEMPTTLWFDDDEPYQLPCLVAAGQATLCYNLMKYLTRRFGAETDAYPDAAHALWERLLADWTAMVADPYALLKGYVTDELERPPSAGRN